MNNEHQDWESYVASERKKLLPLITTLGFSIDAKQPHVSGERFLMQAVTTTSGRKLILLGTRISDGMRVVIKATRNVAGKEEIAHERRCRTFLTQIPFAYQAFLAPPEILYKEQESFLIFIQEYIEQNLSFLERPNIDQFDRALRAFKAQESAHATTYGHRRVVRKVFGERTPGDYLAAFLKFKASVTERFPKLTNIFSQAESLLSDDETIDQYDGFLTHTDFVPHNFRIKGDDLYLLDHSSIRFGNKYEGWARFTNFMALYNPSLEAALVQYVKDNRAPEESRSFSRMRVYRLGEILAYYTNTLDRAIGDLRALNEARVMFWKEVLHAVMRDEQVASPIRETYIHTRDHLRSEEEKKRQIGLH